MDILISNLLSKSIFDFGKWSNWKYANTRICVFSVWPLPKVKHWFWKQIWNENVHISILNFFSGAFRSVFKKVKKMISNCIFKKVMLLLQGSIVKIDFGFFRVFGPYFIGKSLGTFKIFDIGTLVIYPSHLTHTKRVSVFIILDFFLLYARPFRKELISEDERIWNISCTTLVKLIWHY